MCNRIKLIREKLHLTQEEFGQKIGLTQASLSAIETQKRAFSPRHVKIICSTFNVNEQWLLTGQGKMLDPSPKELISLFESLSFETQNCLIAIARELLKAQEKILYNEKKREKCKPKNLEPPSYAAKGGGVQAVDAEACEDFESLNNTMEEIDLKE